MTKSAIDPGNIVELRHFAGNVAPKIPDALYSEPTPSDAANDRFIADGLQLVRSFMLIEDGDMRASIIRLVEKIAEQNRIFNK
ncbi:MAG: hypothetical protein HY244_18290 [Rhizobiales bacterium]|nr:hypothetical protein [Hyphomicrobiales bacterium]